MKQTIHARQALTATGWMKNASIEIGKDGTIATLKANTPNEHAHSVDILLPGVANVHNHSFQRAMAGLAECRSKKDNDDFWSWRALMYKFLDRLTPDDIHTIAAQVQLESLEAGFTSIGEFHYIHHQPKGAPYVQIAELSSRLVEAAQETGIGYTHLPVLYMRGGFDNSPLSDSQRRFRCDINQFTELFGKARKIIEHSPPDFRLGVAPHSLRAVDKESLALATTLSPDSPIHIHIAEQTAEVDAAKAVLGARPVEWLINNAPVNENWCLIHATHMNNSEASAVAANGASVGLCPVTEANLGDGIFNAPEFVDAGGRMCVGSDSNIRISLTEELRMLEYSQRLNTRRRNILTGEIGSCGRFLLGETARVGAIAIGRDAGEMREGALADMVALNVRDTALDGLNGDQLLDSWIFAGDDRYIDDVWSAGRHVVKGGTHIHRDKITPRFLSVMKNLRSSL
ncbi:formimidoylglutamate deiminase [Hyphococcus lacteus]|uniref:Formimidoylglutamate deiminase n=1 Tax=Hyphococcus lacteus TaxID=3143536 RepID=A0ABV3Z4J5_9PROT